MTAQGRKRKPKARKKPNLISADAALATATFLQFTVDNLEGGELLNDLIGFAVQSQQGTTVLPFERLQTLYRKQLQKSCRKASDLLSRAVFAERLFNRLDFKNPKHLVAFIYCLLRLGSTTKNAKKQVEMFKSQFGKNWLWPLVWLIVMEFDLVKTRAVHEKSRGDLFLIEFRDQCQKYANNLWIEERQNLKQIAAKKNIMMESLIRHPIIQALTRS